MRLSSIFQCISDSLPAWIFKPIMPIQPRRSMYSRTMNGNTKKHALQCGIRIKLTPDTAKMPMMVVLMSSITLTR